MSKTINYMYILKRIPKTLLLGIFSTMIISGFDGVVVSTVISQVTSFEQGTDLSKLITFSTLSFLTYILIIISGQLNAMLKNKMIKDLNINLKQEYLEKKLILSNFSKDTDEITSFMLNDFKLFEENYIAILLDITSNTIMGLISMGYLLYLSPLVACLFIICSFLPMLPSKIFAEQLNQHAIKWSKSNEEFTNALKNIFSGRRVIKTYHAYPYAQEKLTTTLTTMEDKNKNLKTFQSLVNYLAAAFSWMSYIIPISVALYFVINGSLASGTVIALFLASDRVIVPLRMISMYSNQINTTKEIRHNIYSVISTPTVYASTDTTQLDKIDITLDNVTFSYPNGKELFTNLSTIIKFGEKVLISGSSGSGKTSLLDLIQGIHLPNSGSISAHSNGQSITNITEHISRISQEPFMFDGTIKENLSLGKHFSDEDILAALNQVGLLDELGENILSQTYTEKNNNLSGGQKQRIEIARAILNKKSILLVDEATSSLDQHNSAKIRKILSTLPSTVIEVAHHFTEQDIVDYNLKHIKLPYHKLL